MRDWLKQKLNIPDNWDKHDYRIKQYSFEDIEDILIEYQEEQIANAVKQNDDFKILREEMREFMLLDSKNMLTPRGKKLLSEYKFIIEQYLHATI
jgi:hypothetical protein